MGGIIAYEGDLIGRRFGKKRVTLFGLRPRHTAILITSVTGVAISAITTGVLFLVVPSIREVILQGEHALTEVPKLKTQKQILTDERNALESKAGGLQKEVGAKQAQLAQLTIKADRTEKLLEQRESRLSYVETRLGQAQSRLTALQARFTSLNARYAALSTKNEHLSMANEALATGNIKLASENSKLQTENQQMVQQNAVLARQNGELAQEFSDGSRRNEDLTRQNTKLSRDNVDLEKERTRLTGVIERQREVFAQQTDKNLRLTTENTRLSSENTALHAFVKKFGPGYDTVRDAYWAARSRRVAVHKDEDLARITIPANTPPEGVKTQLMELLRRSSDAAKARGASPGEGLRAVQIVNREFLSRLPNGEVETYQQSGEDRIDAVASKLCWQSTSCAVLALAVANSVEDEPAAIDLQPFPNRRIFLRGQAVQGRYFNATQPIHGIFDDVVKFLKEMGRYALEQGVIPRMDPLTGEPEVGAMTGSEIVDLVDKIQKAGGRVHVRAIAEQDIYSADPLKVRFAVMP
jgi:predicted  nucleic acid-binding Zn-ribbon protein